VARLAVETGGILEWVPELTIPFAGSRFRQVIHVTLARGATVLLWDAMASGRVARGERWAFHILENEVRIRTGSRKFLLERYELIPGDAKEVGLASEWDYVGSFYMISEAINEERWKRLEESVGEILDGCRDRVLAGVSEPSVQGRVVRLLTKSAQDLLQFCNHFGRRLGHNSWVFRSRHFVATSGFPYQMPRPIITIPMTSQPKTPAAIRLSRLIEGPCG
jgi:urease accessory protein